MYRLVYPSLVGGNDPKRSNPTFSKGMSTSVLVSVLPSVQRVVGWLVIWQLWQERT
jgi:hypothetical protein